MQNRRTPEVARPAPTLEMAEGIKNGLLEYVKAMESMGYIITVERESMKPLAMGNAQPVVSVRLANSEYRKAK